jgi:hypothetical protein
LPELSHLRSGEDFLILTYIDNILVLGRTADVAAQVSSLISSRAALAGVRLDNHLPCRPWGWTPPPTQRFEFLGESFDLSERTVSQAAKTNDKLHVVDLRRLSAGAQPTRRQLAAVVGLCMFASACGAAQASMYRRFPALRFYARQVSSPKGATVDWDGLCDPLPASASACFGEWIEELRANAPAALSLPASPRPATDVIFVDASEQGWAAVHIDVATGVARVVYSKWSSMDRAEWDLSSSVAAEPLAMRFALCRFITPSASSSVVVYTDHKPIVDALRSSCAKTYSYWRLQRLVSSLAPTQISIFHISGVSNPADGFTRGDPSSVDVEAGSPWCTTFDNAVQHHHARESEELAVAPAPVSEWAATSSCPFRVLPYPRRLQSSRVTGLREVRPRLCCA